MCRHVGFFLDLAPNKTLMQLYLSGISECCVIVIFRLLLPHEDNTGCFSLTWNSFEWTHCDPHRCLLFFRLPTLCCVYCCGFTETNFKKGLACLCDSSLSACVVDTVLSRVNWSTVEEISQAPHDSMIEISSWGQSQRGWEASAAVRLCYVTQPRVSLRTSAGQFAQQPFLNTTFAAFSPVCGLTAAWV